MRWDLNNVNVDYNVNQLRGTHKFSTFDQYNWGIDSWADPTTTSTYDNINVCRWA